jgi:hypothetical protein
MNQKDIDLIGRVYRIRRLLTTHEAAAESTYKIVCGMGVSHQQVLEISDAENRRKKLTLDELNDRMMMLGDMR